MKHVSANAIALTALLAATACSLLSCKSAAPAPPAPPSASKAAVDSRAASTAMLVDHARLFNQIVAQMPGNSGAIHRQLLVSALGELSAVLRSANGSVQSPVFANRIAVIDAAAKTASMQSIPRARLQAVENQAIHSASKALDEIASRYLFDDGQLPAMLQTVNMNAGVSEAVMGPMHDLDATETFRAIQAVVQRITDDMVERFAPGSGGNEVPAAVEPAATVPATAPMMTPTTTPATMP